MWLAIAGLPLFVSIDVLGAVSVYVAAEGLLVAAIVFGQDRLSLAYGARGHVRESLPASIRLVLLATVIATMPAVLLLGYVTDQQIQVRLLDLGFVVAMTTSAFYRVDTSALRGQGDLVFFSRARLVFSATRLVVLWIAILLLGRGIGPEAAQGAYVVALGTASVLGLLVTRRSGRLPRLRRTFSDGLKVRKYGTLGLPLVAHGLAMMGLIFVDRLMLGAMASLTSVGHYTLAYIPASIAIFGFSYIAVAREPDLIRSVAEGSDGKPEGARRSATSSRSNHGVASSYLRRMLYAGSSLLVLGAAGLPVLAGFSRVAFLDVLPLYLLLAAAHIIWPPYLVASAVLLARDLSGRLATASVTAAVANVALNAILIPIMAESGAALATLLSYSLLSAVSARAARSASQGMVWFRMPSWALCLYSTVALGGLLVYSRG